MVICKGEQMFYSVTTVDIVPEMLDEVVLAAKTLSQHVQNETGYVEYRLLKLDDDDSDDGNDTKSGIVFFEIWQTKEDFIAHVAAGSVVGSPLNEFGKVMARAEQGDSLHFGAQPLT
jgi:quinol monooxygenase YgiN